MELLVVTGQKGTQFAQLFVFFVVLEGRNALEELLVQLCFLVPIEPLKK